jgi:hypothetical protein
VSPTIPLRGVQRGWYKVPPVEPVKSLIFQGQTRENPQSFLGHIIFRVEGGLVTNRMRWPLAEELRRQVDVECSGPGCPDAMEILELIRDDIPRLNEARAAVMGAARD